MKIQKIVKLKQKNQTLAPISAADLETVEFNGIQIVLAFSAAYNTSEGIKSIFCKADTSIMDRDVMVDQLWAISINKLWEVAGGTVCFIHNLGNFDGFFLYRGLINILGKNNVSALLNKNNEFIQITAVFNDQKIIFKDSQRIFPLSLNKLTMMWSCENVKNKPYNPKFNTLQVLTPDEEKEFKNYSILDSISLLEAMNNASKHYLENFGVVLSSIWSTSSLAMKIYRLKFLKDREIPTFNKNVDSFIRDSYYGGGNDHYHVRGVNLKYFDINSLYPYAMCNLMPNKLLKIHYNMSSIKLENFFGFIKCIVIAPKTIKTPILPYRDLKKGITAAVINPTGTWIATYFSEELKAAVKLGYQIKPLTGYEFSKINLFEEYVEHFYHIKSNSSGVLRNSAKLMLNTLYGYFGRKLDYLQTVNVDKEILDVFLTTHNVYSIIEVNNNVFTLLIDSEKLNFNKIRALNITIQKSTEKIDKFRTINSNIAIASAVTSYARIHMIPFKTSNKFKCLYTDTDSVIIEGNLDSSLISNKLGMMKDELDGKVIKEAIFLGNKKYCYTFEDDEGVLQTRSVFSGAPRNSLTMEDFKKMLNGESVSITLKSQFVKTIRNLNVKIKEKVLRLRKSEAKKIVGDKYIPKHLIYYPGKYKKQNLNIIKFKINFAKNKLYRFLKRYYLQMFNKLKM